MIVNIRLSIIVEVYSVVVVVVVRGRSNEGGSCSVSGSEDSSQCKW